MRLEHVLQALPAEVQDRVRASWDLNAHSRRLGVLAADLRSRHQDLTPTGLKRAATLVTEADLEAFCHEHGLDSEPPTGSESSDPEADDSSCFRV